MFGVLGVFETIFLGLIWAAQRDNLWDVGSNQTNILAYSASTALTAYLEIEVINTVRQWFYNKEYSRDELENSWQNAGNSDDAEPEPSSSADASQNNTNPEE